MEVRATEAAERAISTHALREEGDVYVDRYNLAFVISTHALREEGDLFQQRDSPFVFVISTHALREEGDSKCAIKQKLFSGSICTMRYNPRKKRAVFVQAALSLERSLHV